jgi:hypothetical protein
MLQLSRRWSVLSIVLAGMGVGMCVGAVAWKNGANAVATPSSTVHLASGRVAQFKWRALAFRPNSQGGSQRPCLYIGFKPLRSRSEGPIEIRAESTNCAPLRPIPNLVSVVDELHKPRMTGLVMGFGSEVHSVSLYFKGRTADRTIQLHLLSKSKAAKGHLVPFRYGSFAFAGDSCVSRFVAHSKDGGVLYDGGRMRCGGAQRKDKRGSRQCCAWRSEGR